MREDTSYLGLPRWHSGNKSACKSSRCGFCLWVRKILWSRKWQLTPVFLPGKFHPYRSLAGYSPGIINSSILLSSRACTHTHTRFFLSLFPPKCPQYSCLLQDSQISSLLTQSVKSLTAMQDTWIRSRYREDSLEKEMASHSVGILAWRIPWTEEPGRLQSMGSQESDMME